MELKIISRKEYPLLSRTGVEAEATFDKATPSESEVKSQLANALGKDGKLLVVRSIRTIYGSKKAGILAYAYENEEALKTIEKEKNKSGKKETKGKEAPKEEKKAEEPKEKAKEAPKEKE